MDTTTPPPDLRCGPARAPRFPFPLAVTRARPPGAPQGPARGVSAARGVFLLCTLLLVALAPDTAAASGPTRSTASAGAAWSWPTGTPVPVVRAFDPPEQRWQAGHRGVDLDVDIGSTVLAPADGVVTWAGPLVDRAVVSVQHEGVRSTFEPVEALVSRGQHVVRGQVLGTVTEGHSPGALHWGAKVSQDSYVDPLRMLVGPVVLKPWD